MTLQCKKTPKAPFPNYQRFLRAPLVPAQQRISPPNANDASKSSPVPTRHSTNPAKMLQLPRHPGPNVIPGSSSLFIASSLPNQWQHQSSNQIIATLLSAVNDGDKANKTALLALDGSNGSPFRKGHNFQAKSLNRYTRLRPLLLCPFETDYSPRQYRTHS
jgi:hypothetical protein